METRLTRDKSEVRAVLSEQVAKGIELQTMDVADEQALIELRKRISVWTDYNRQYLQIVFTNDSFAKKYDRAAGGVTIAMNPSLQERIDKAREFIQRDVEALQEVSERIEYVPDEPEAAGGTMTAGVYLIGTAGAISDALARLGLQATVLEAPTAEEIAGIPHQSFVVSVTDGSADSVARAACAIGRLGPERVCVLSEDNDALPADIPATPLDPAGAWKLALVKQLKTAGYNVTADDLL